MAILFGRGLRRRRETEHSRRCGRWCLRLGLFAFLVGLLIATVSLAGTLRYLALEVVGAAEHAVLMLHKAYELRCLAAAAAVALLGLVANAVLDRPRAHGPGPAGNEVVDHPPVDGPGG